MTTSLHEAAWSVVRHFLVTGEKAFVEDGRPAIAASSPAALTLLEHRIYVRCHLRVRQLPERDATVDAGLRRTLRARVGARVSADDGWELVTSAGSRARVRKDGITLTVSPRELGATPGAAPGDMVSVRFPAGRPCALPGWFVYVSRHGQPLGIDGLWRMYANVRMEHAASALGRLSCWLEAHDARFQLKLLDGSWIGSRPDALVVFTSAPHLDAAMRCAARMAADGWLADATPGFATRVAAGVAIAPELTSVKFAGRSYGQACARAAAEAAFEAWRRRIDSEDERFALIAEHLERCTATDSVIRLMEAA